MQYVFGFRGELDREVLSLYMNTIDKAVEVDKRQ